MIIFFTLVLMHVVGDFYLQTNLIATRKSNFDCANKGFVNIKYLTFHTLLYWIPFFLCFFLLQWDWCLLVLPVISLGYRFVYLLVKKTYQENFYISTRSVPPYHYIVHFL